VDEGDLIDRVLAGEPAAERTLYDTYVDRVYGIAYRFTGDEDVARDVTQDTFIRAFDRIGTFRRESSIGTWLHSIAVSVALNRVRVVQRSRRRETTLDDALDVSSGTRIAEPDLKERLSLAVDALPPGYRSVFLLHDVEGFTHREIAQVLGIDEGTSKAQLFRARHKLRTILADFAGEWLS